jgi:hypothetical protein
MGSMAICSERRCGRTASCGRHSQFCSEVAEGVAYLVVLEFGSAVPLGELSGDEWRALAVG